MDNDDVDQKSIHVDGGEMVKNLSTPTKSVSISTGDTVSVCHNNKRLKMCDAFDIYNSYQAACKQTLKDSDEHFMHSGPNRPRTETPNFASNETIDDRESPTILTDNFQSNGSKTKAASVAIKNCLRKEQDRLLGMLHSQRSDETDDDNGNIKYTSKN